MSRYIRKSPEFQEGIYQDTGCPIHPKCMECPLPQCIHDLRISTRQLQAYIQMAKVYPLVKATRSVKELSSAAEVTQHQAYVLKNQYNRVHGDYVGFILYKIRHKATNTTCIHGHKFSLENTHIDLRGYKVCRTCRRNRWNANKNNEKRRKEYKENRDDLNKRRRKRYALKKQLGLPNPPSVC